MDQQLLPQDHNQEVITQLNQVQNVKLPRYRPREDLDGESKIPECKRGFDVGVYIDETGH